MNHEIQWHNVRINVGLTRTIHLYLLLAVSLIGAAIRLPQLGHHSLWLDEVQIYWFAQGKLSTILEQNATYNSAPPLFVLLISFIDNFGSSEIYLRIIPVLFGILGIPAIWFLANQFVGKNIALFISLLVAISPTMVTYSQEVREYSLTFFLATCMLFCFVTFLKQPRRIHQTALATIIGFAILTQYGLAILILALNLIFGIYLIRGKLNSSQVQTWAMVQFLGLFISLFVYFTSLEKQLSHGSFASNTYLATAYWDGSLESLRHLIIWQSLRSIEFVYPVLPLFSLLVIWGIVISIRRHQWLVIQSFVAPFIVTICFAILGVFPHSGTRQTLFLSPMIFVMMGIGLESIVNISGGRLLKLTKKFTLTVIIITLTLIGLINTIQTTYNSGAENMRPIVPIFENLWEKRDSIYLGCAAEPAYRYYFPETGLPTFVSLEENYPNENLYQAVEPF